MIKKRFFLEILLTGICSLVISNNVNATQTVKIAIPYTDQEVAGKNENNLKIFKFDVGSQTWTELLSTPHPAENYVEAEADSFGDKYALVSLNFPTQNDFYSAWFAGEGGKNEVIVKLNADSYIEIRIHFSPYMGGDLIRRLYSGSLTKGKYKVYWDGKNDDGDDVSIFNHYYAYLRINGAQFGKIVEVRPYYQ
ncbi:MAG: hypothetical protein AB1422_09375 [bacterium]